MSANDVTFNYDEGAQKFYMVVPPEVKTMYIDEANALQGLKTWSGGGPKKKEGERAPYATQKARGVNALNKEAFRPLRAEWGLMHPIPYGCVKTLPHDIDYLRENKTFWLDYGQALFARPCPTVPRHGFVDSRQVTNFEELMQVFRETRLADPNGEVLVMPMLTGKCSGVVTNAGVTWGRGNDGVTAGHDNIFIPCPVSPAQWAMLELDPYAGRDYETRYWEDMRDAVPYIEMVEHEGEIVPVQVRAGPPLAASRHYIPKTMTVKKILDVNVNTAGTNALLAWESQINAYKGFEGVLVYGEYLSLASHWAIHAIQNGIPVYTGVPRPKIGDTLEPETSVPTPMNEENLATLAGYLKKYRKTNFKEYNHLHMLATAMATSHACAFWNGQDHLIKLRALAVELIERFVAAACIGEDRHFYGYGPGRDSESVKEEDFDSYEEYANYIEENNCSWHKETSNLPWKEAFGAPTDRYKVRRENVFKRVLSTKEITPKKRISYLECVLADFEMTGWENTADTCDCSYGGPNWAIVTKAVIDLRRAADRFMESPTHENWGIVATRMNLAVHAAHNGGCVLTKWLRSQALNYIAEKPHFGFMNKFAADVALGEV